MNYRYIDPYPVGLIKDIDPNKVLGTNMNYDDLRDDQVKGLEYVLKNALSEKYYNIIMMKYKYMKPVSEIAKYYNLEETSVVYDRLSRIFKILRNPYNARYIVCGKDTLEETIDYYIESNRYSLSKVNVEYLTMPYDLMHYVKYNCPDVENLGDLALKIMNASKRGRDHAHLTKINGILKYLNHYHLEEVINYTKLYMEMYDEDYWVDVSKETIDAIKDAMGEFDRERPIDIIKRNVFECESMNSIAKSYDVTTEAIRQSKIKAFRHIKKYIEKRRMESLEEQYKATDEYKWNCFRREHENLCETNIKDLGLSRRTCHGLERTNLRTVDDVCEYIMNNPMGFQDNIKGFGWKCRIEIIHTLVDKGVDKYFLPCE